MAGEDIRKVYETNYTPAQFLNLDRDAYTLGMIKVRFDLVRKYGAGRDVLDVCCGSGAYLTPFLGLVRSAVGLDFAHNMLCGLRNSLKGAFPDNLTLVEADARRMPLLDRSFDFAYSYASLYSVPNVSEVISEVGRVLRADGYCALELGNQRSLNTIVSEAQHQDLGWVQPCHVHVRDMREMFDAAGLEPIEWRCFQLSPMYGAPRRHPWLLPLVTSYWRPVAAINIAGRMIDEWLSSAWPFRMVAFRHLVVARRR